MRTTHLGMVVMLLVVTTAVLASTTTTSVRARALVTQTSLRLEQLQIDLWPEFDRPDMLVIYRGTLPTDVPLPATVTLRLPARVGEPHAVAYNDGSGNLLEASYSTTLADDWLLVSVEAPTPNFQLEYYDNLTRVGDERIYTFTWPGDYAVDQLDFALLPPVGASQIQTKPVLSPFQQATGAIVYGTTFGNVVAGENLQMTMSYRGGTAGTDKAHLFTTGEKTDNVLLIAGAIVAALALVIGGTVWYTRRSRFHSAQASPHWQRRAKIKSRSSKATATHGKASPTGYCTQCGHSVRADDRFCGYCGTPVKQKTE
jgi:hypothetical protein